MYGERKLKDEMKIKIRVSQECPCLRAPVRGELWWAVAHDMR